MTDDQDPTSESPEKAWTEMSVEEKAESFNEWAIRDAPMWMQQNRIEADKYFIATKYEDGKTIFRNYFDVNANGTGFENIAGYNWDNNRKSLIIIDGELNTEGFQKLNYQQLIDQGLRVESMTEGIRISCFYTIQGELMYIRFGEGHEYLSFPFTRGDKTQTLERKLRIIDKLGEEFVDCIKEEEEGEKVKVHYRVPKKINIEEGVDKLISPRLLKDPYNAPASEDKWLVKSFLDAFGIKRVA